MKNNKGFTLLEIIVVLVLVGLLSAVAGMGIVIGVKEYLFAKENASTAQKAVLAISRLSREFKEIVDITHAAAGAITYQHLDGHRSVALVGGGINKEIRMISGTTLPEANTGDVLINNVNSFTLTYCKYGETTTCTWQPWPASGQNLLTRIKISLVINRADSGIGTLNFSTEINPRNTGTYNEPVKF